MKKNIALFASGNGSNAQALMQFAKDQLDPAQLEIKVLISDVEGAFCLTRAKKMAVPSICHSFVQYKLEHAACSYVELKKKYEQKLIEYCREYAIDWVFLCGYMRILSPLFLDAFYDEKNAISKVVNIHPSLLPSFKGANAYDDTFLAGVKVSGVTVHLVDAGIDTGPIILQDTFVRKDEDDLAQFKQRGLALEHILFPQVLQLVAEDKLQVVKNNNTKKNHYIAIKQ